MSERHSAFLVLIFSRQRRASRVTTDLSRHEPGLLLEGLRPCQRASAFPRESEPSRDCRPYNLDGIFLGRLEGYARRGSLAFPCNAD